VTRVAGIRSALLRISTRFSWIFRHQASYFVFIKSIPLSLWDLHHAVDFPNGTIPILISADRSLPRQGFADVLDSVKGSGFRPLTHCSEEKRRSIRPELFNYPSSPLLLSPLIHAAIITAMLSL
jgi:hypothetical protein